MSLPPPTTSADLAAASAAFARLRDTTPLGARITEALWSRAVELASTHGVGRVARTLRLDYARLKRRLHGESAVLAPAPPALEAIRALLAEHPELSRRAFSQRLCAHWDWRQPTRALRDGVCRSLLLALHRGGHLTLAAGAPAAPEQRHRAASPGAAGARYGPAGVPLAGAATRGAGGDAPHPPRRALRPLDPRSGSWTGAKAVTCGR